MSGFDRWVGKVAVVTGASAGIGANIAERLVKEGLKVVGLARRNELIEEASKKLSKEKGKLYSIKCDVANEEDVIKAFKWIKENVGPVHILINNAGIASEGNLIEGETKTWKKVFDVNVFGILISTREAVKVMKEYNIDGHVININSILGHIDAYVPYFNVYSATKHAVTNLTETYRKEFNANKLKIKITSVSPGLVDTDIINANSLPKDHIVNEPFLKSEDITDAVIYALATKPHVQVHEIMIRPVLATY